MNTITRSAPLYRRAFSIEEVIAISGFNRNRVYALIAQNKLRTFKTGRRRFVTAAALDECINALEAETEKAAA